MYHNGCIPGWNSKRVSGKFQPTRKNFGHFCRSIPLPLRRTLSETWWWIAKLGKSTWRYRSLTHLPLDTMAAISQTIFSDAFSWMKSFVFWSKFHWSLFPRVKLTIKPNIGLDNNSAPYRRQAIIWTNADPIHWRIYESLGGDEFSRNQHTAVKCWYIYLSGIGYIEGGMG